MEKYQQEIWDLINNPNLGPFISTPTRGNSLYEMLMAQPFFEVLEYHWEYPGKKRVDVSISVASWIHQQDNSQWEDTGVIIIGNYNRFIITPELLTLLTLKFA